MRLEIIERKLVEALVILLINAKGKVVSIRATSLAKMAGFGNDHSAILKAARFLQKLSKYQFIRVATETKRNKTYRYLVKTDDELWQLVRRDPERAKEIIIKLISK
ncbi:hypothetical protein [Pyrobaculum ferrireducens]|uniref:Uncharacterized protein n=1 Tax=Pyrobaculum ferrireducens TaxID=1104324 RepID=G7VBD2_9CREN|nr:hypothetical protein [Pyrobaculum ferrireducens]AET33629.1 hypothetical protein P186_2237 [Pyrobaculum ferrireducens]